MNVYEGIDTPVTLSSLLLQKRGDDMEVRLNPETAPAVLSRAVGYFAKVGDVVGPIISVSRIDDEVTLTVKPTVHKGGLMWVIPEEWIAA